MFIIEDALTGPEIRALLETHFAGMLARECLAVLAEVV